MANPIKARSLGDEYQILFFWLKACDMLKDHSNVDTISYEDQKIKSLDDIVIRYKKPTRDMTGKLVHKEYYQVKYHVDYRNSITLENLISPKFINAAKYSFLEKVKEAIPDLNKEDEPGVAFLVTPWSIHPDDPLAKLKIVDTKGGYFKEEILFDGKSKSHIAKIRGTLKNHLKIEDDEELKIILEAIRIRSNFHQYESLIQFLNGQLLTVGLKPIDLSQRINPYVDLLRRLFQEDQTKFNKEELIEICKSEDLWIGHNIMLNEEVPIGIRSFNRRAENLENNTTTMTCLLHYFEGRYLKDEFSWNIAIKGALEDFIRCNLAEDSSYCIYLDTHSTIAFTTGFFLDPKSGIKAVPIQKGLSGRAIWRSDSRVPREQYPMWQVSHDVIDENGSDIVIVIEMTHPAVQDVKDYIETNQLSAKSILRFYFEESSGFNSIHDGNHAMYLANEISKTLNGLQKEDKKRRYHFFGAGPNGFWFFLGQLSRNFGQLTLYEYDIEITKDYFPTIDLP
ncbi:SAVED domain-containing protein [Exiguobacterium sp. KJ 601]|uniref:SAVED domain-containing protein n=1 Tax=Exiguobacterium sp. KJ 601 TaxID=2782569 RepID=UPI0022AE89B0|nr:SAVED domain-containing protein [Exiguobacterium sp. KJ 601]